MKILIQKISGKWLVNGKPYSEISDEEKKFFDDFIHDIKIAQECLERRGYANIVTKFALDANQK